MKPLRFKPSKGKSLTAAERRELIAFALERPHQSHPEIIGGIQRTTYARTGDKLVLVTRDEESPGRIYEEVLVCRVEQKASRYLP